MVPLMIKGNDYFANVTSTSITRTPEIQIWNPFAIVLAEIDFLPSGILASYEA